jgi:hypothetical protein
MTAQAKGKHELTTHFPRRLVKNKGNTIETGINILIQLPGEL